MSSLEPLRHAKELVSSWRGSLSRYERHISAVAMIAGFGIDNYTFGRIDRPAANIIFAAYLALAAGSIVILHRMQSRADKKLAQAILAGRREKKLQAPAALEQSQTAASAGVATLDAFAASQAEAPAAAMAARPTFGKRLHAALPAATQFALGGLWSGFLVFYSRSAVVAASWPFLVLLTVIFIGNEVFRRYRDRLVFTSLLLFFALYSYAVFVVPVFLGRIGSVVFALSGLLAIVVFIAFLRLLRMLGRERFRQVRVRLYGGAFAILAIMNLFYFADILPPLPLALADAGVYHSVKRNGAVYQAMGEEQAMTARFNLSRPTVHLAPGETVSVYSAVFAPIRLSTRISHRWEWFDPARKRWVLQSRVVFPISGGREGGYRGYTIKSKPKPGDWRVDIDTEDGRLIGRVAFRIEAVPQPVATTQKTIS